MKYLVNSIANHPWWWFFGVNTGLVLADLIWWAVGLSVYVLLILSVLRFLAGAREEDK